MYVLWNCLFFSDKPKAPKSTIEVFKEIYSRHGIRGLFAGTVPRLIKVAPACAIMISSFEYGKIFFNRLANQQFAFSSKQSEPDVSTITQKLPSTKTTSFKDRQVLSQRNEEILWNNLVIFFLLKIVFLLYYYLCSCS